MAWRYVGVPALGLVFIFVAWSVHERHRAANRLLQGGRLYEGEVSRISCTRREKGCDAVVAIRLSDGKVIYATGPAGKGFREGHRVRVVFDPKKPRKFFLRREAGSDDTGVVILALVGAAMILGWLGFGFLRIRSRQG